MIVPMNDPSIVAQPGKPGQDIIDSDEFRMYYYKVIPCKMNYSHDWSECPFAHPGEKAQRRCPRTHMYMGLSCPALKKTGACPRGASCCYAHNSFEYWLHPSRYRTQFCTYGVNCRRPVCFFAHTMPELRLPGGVMGPSEQTRTAAEAMFGTEEAVVPDACDARQMHAQESFMEALPHSIGHSDSSIASETMWDTLSSASSNTDVGVVPVMSAAQMMSEFPLMSRQLRSTGYLEKTPHMPTSFPGGISTATSPVKIPMSRSPVWPTLANQMEAYNVGSLPMAEYNAVPVGMEQAIWNMRHASGWIQA